MLPFSTGSWEKRGFRCIHWFFKSPIWDMYERFLLCDTEYLKSISHVFHWDSEKLKGFLQKKKTNNQPDKIVNLGIWPEATTYRGKSQTGWESAQKIPPNWNSHFSEVLENINMSLWYLIIIVNFLLIVSGEYKHFKSAVYYSFAQLLSNGFVIPQFHFIVSYFCMGRRGFLIQKRFFWNLKNLPAEQCVHRRSSHISRTAFLENELIIKNIFANCIVDFIWSTAH